MHYTGADLTGIVREAALMAIRRSNAADMVRMEDYIHALHQIQPTISEDMLTQYTKFTERFGGVLKG